ncbi:MAG: hypothetical protein L7U72_02030 [Rubripirellula sp.]|nr:hypothetical protein [Rubripirellula sp.]
MVCQRNGVSRAKIESYRGRRDWTGDTLGVIYGVDYGDSLNDVIGWRGTHGLTWGCLIGLIDQRR